eukprot:SAG11_NODE_368_length_10082_cov_299.189622_2_plen_71_part_00
MLPMSKLKLASDEQFSNLMPENDVASETIDERVARLKGLREQIYESILEYRTQVKEVLDKRVSDVQTSRI